MGKRVKNGKIVCRICKKKFGSITNTHLIKHGLTLEDYIKIYNLKPEDWKSNKQIEHSNTCDMRKVKAMNRVTKKLYKEGKAYLQSKQARSLNSLRMKKNNPMFDKNISKKVGKTLKEKWKNESHPNKGNKRPDFSEWLKENNPMKDKDYARLVLRRSKLTLVKNGNISKVRKLYIII